MRFTKIQPYGPDAYSYWIAGIYKIVSYRKGRYHAYFIQDWATNWGDYVATPPCSENQQGIRFTYWSTLKAAKAACCRHSKTHQPSAMTIKRAADLKTTLTKQAEDYTEAA